MDKNKNSDEFDVVVIRKIFWTPGLIALFPEIPADSDGNFCQFYMHIGQHGAADYHYIVRHSAPAIHNQEYKDLLAELKEHGYHTKPILRATSAMHAKRRDAAKRQEGITRAL